MEPWTMPGWINVPIGEYLSNRFGIPVWLEIKEVIATLFLIRVLHKKTRSMHYQLRFKFWKHLLKCTTLKM